MCKMCFFSPKEPTIKRHKFHISRRSRCTYLPRQSKSTKPWLGSGLLYLDHPKDQPLLFGWLDLQKTSTLNSWKKLAPPTWKCCAMLLFPETSVISSLPAAHNSRCLRSSKPCAWCPPRLIQKPVTWVPKRMSFQTGMDALIQSYGGRECFSINPTKFREGLRGFLGYRDLMMR